MSLLTSDESQLRTMAISLIGCTGTCNVALFGFHYKEQTVSVASSQWYGVLEAGLKLGRLCGARNQGGATVIFGKSKE